MINSFTKLGARNQCNQNVRFSDNIDPGGMKNPRNKTGICSKRYYMGCILRVGIDRQPA